MSFFYYPEIKKIRWGNIIMIIIMLIVVFFMINPMKEELKYNKKEMYCEVTYCSKTTLDLFKECVYIGYEEVGFLSGNNYYLCDGNKITKSCLEYGRKEFEGNFILYGFGKDMSCERREDG